MDFRFSNLNSLERLPQFHSLCGKGWWHKTSKRFRTCASSNSKKLSEVASKTRCWKIVVSKITAGFVLPTFAHKVRLFQRTLPAEKKCDIGISRAILAAMLSVNPSRSLCKEWTSPCWKWPTRPGTWKMLSSSPTHFLLHCLLCPPKISERERETEKKTNSAVIASSFVSSSGLWRSQILLCEPGRENHATADNLGQFNR